MRTWQILFLISLAALPVQLGKFFFLRGSYVLGLPIDYLAIAVYFSEIIIFALIVSFLWAIKNNWKKILAPYRPFVITGTAFVLYIFTLTVLTNPISPIGLYFDLKIAGLFIYSLIAAEFFSTTNIWSPAKKVLNFSLLWVSLLIVAEFALQRSLGLWFLGERSFDTSTSGIAHFNLSGLQLLRSYGTFPHPNVAGAFIVIYLVLSFSLLRYPERSEGSTNLSSPRRRGSRKKSFASQNRPNTRFPLGPQRSEDRMALYIKSGMTISVLGLIALLLTFSKAAIFALILYVLLTFDNRKIRLAIISTLVVVAFFLVGAQQLIPIDSIAERLSLSQAALDISLKNPLFGVGPTNFIPQLATLNLYSIAQTRLLQPVHNVFLIFLVESGIVGLLLFASVLLAAALRATTKTKQALFVILLCFASIDHFFITIHQGQLLFWLALGYILAREKPTKNSKS